VNKKDANFFFLIQAFDIQTNIAMLFSAFRLKLQHSIYYGNEVYDTRMFKQI